MEEHIISNVWQLENNAQLAASDELSIIIQEALDGSLTNQKYLSELWDNELWSSIKKKLMTEGSAWYVWWMDGVNAHLRKFQSYGDCQ